MSPRTIAILAGLLAAVRVVTARVPLLPGVSVPAGIPLGACMLAVIIIGAWLLRRHARAYLSCPFPHDRSAAAWQGAAS